MKVDLSKDEIQLVLHCLRIGAEDGSIYGGDESEEDSASVRATNAMVQSVENRLRAALSQK